MDKKKKTVVIIVGLACFILLVVIFKVFIFPSENTNPRTNKLFISTPKVNDDKVDKTSKLNAYKREELENSKKSDVVKGFTDLNEAEETDTITYDPIIQGQAIRDFDRLNPKGDLQKKQTSNRTPKTGYVIDNDQADKEIQELMELQKQLLRESTYTNSTNNKSSEIDDIQKLMDVYNNYSQASLDRQLPNGENSLIGNINPENITKLGTGASETIKNSIQDKLKDKSFFHGAGSASQNNEVLDLIPAETVDQTIINNGSTIAIRTKKEIKLTSPRVTIPKGAVVYGKVTININRLLIDITSYKQEDKLYRLDFSMYDFDGVEGVHLGNRTWPKIPSQVAKDVYDYAYQRGTQAAAFGGNNSINLEEAKNIAMLSASKELGREIFEKRRVFMPKKYHLWIHINTKENE